MATLSEKKSANAVGGKTARACDSCLRRRARWYCAADDAFLCQSCDTLVHSANPLARRHERVRLKTSSSSSPIQSFKHTSLPTEISEPAAPSWHKGFKRKARTPRSRYSAMAPSAPKSEPLVPDFEATSVDETAEDEEEEEEQLLYRVPIFDPVLAEFCSGHGSDDSAATSSGEAKPAAVYESSSAGIVNALPGFDVDMGEFSADVESLLGRVLDEDAFSMEGLGLMEAGGDVNDCCFVGGGYVKLETSDGEEHNGELLDLNFECGSPSKMSIPAPKRRRIALRLDYEGVINAWSSAQGCSSPWADGERPQVNPEECLPDFIGLWGEVPSLGYGGGEMSGGAEGGQSGGGGSHSAAGDGGRETRVSRYREKRRTRLFSKKIRYEVRKLNAEKRPRMKGRFVKSASFGGAAGTPAGVAVKPAFAF